MGGDHLLFPVNVSCFFVHVLRTFPMFGSSRGLKARNRQESSNGKVAVPRDDGQLITFLRAFLSPVSRVINQTSTLSFVSSPLRVCIAGVRRLHHIDIKRMRRSA